jgi:hypothetical protein
MKTHEARRKIIRAWMALPKDRQEPEMQRIVNAFFFGVTIFSVAFAYFVSPRGRKISTILPSMRNS